ncbi:DUF2130 domain-containing protein [Mesorhizobium sp. RIZ17]|uniref:DUF2130 domain-containing protein n=1 Tax=Mesorhizobium sp. RIZ17 TaxID=3132743 RepID=UPI003DA8E8DC
MPASHSHIMKPSSARPAPPKLMLAEDVCPLCDQAIPHDHAEEIKERIELRQREQATELASRLQEQFERDKALAVEQTRQEAAAALGQVQQEAEARISAARAEARQAAEAAAQEQLESAALASSQALEALNEQIATAEAAKVAAEDAIESVKAEAAASEEKIRAEAKTAAEAAIQSQLEEFRRQREQAELALTSQVETANAARIAAEAGISSLRETMEQKGRDYAAAIEKLKEDAAANEADIRRQAQVAAESVTQERVAGLEQAKTAADARAAAAEEQIQTLQKSHETVLAERLQEQREALERAKTDAVNAEKSSWFDEKLKFSAKIEELQRTVDKKTAEELGEGAEIVLLEALKGEFTGDIFEPVGRGLPGADIIHTVIHNGRECGKIIYDSKNHNAWRNDFVTKLSTDQLAAKAEHAILSTRKFPQGVRHLHVQDGVILASPSRVVALVHIVRQHLVHTHTLKMSNEAKAQKTAALYSYITSERCSGFFSRIDAQTDDLLDLQRKEMKAHQSIWKQQGELLRSVQKVGAEFRSEIDAILGTSHEAETSDA